MTPDERMQPEDEKLVALNADSLDAGLLDEQTLEDVAGGMACPMNCTVLYTLPDPTIQ
jgi:hypothetical protein